MVIKGKACAGGVRLAKHLERTDTNETMELRELRGVCAEDLTEALREIEAGAIGTRCQRPFYHASINTRADEVMTPEQEQRAIDRLEEELGLTDQPRAVVAHVKEGRAHLHIVWGRVDEAGKTISDSHNYRRHELVARELEREFGHARVQGAHIERDGVARPERTPSHAEMQIAARTGLTPKEAKAEITAIWQRTDSGAAFQAALAEEGWILAAGDRRDFVVVDRFGEPHSLARRIEGAKAKDVRERLADLDRDALPSVDAARALQAERQAEKARGGDERAPPTPPAISLEPTPQPIPDQVPNQAKTAEPPRVAGLEAAKAEPEVTGSAHLGVASQLRHTKTPAAPQPERQADAPRERPTPAEGVRSPGAAAAKLADGAANLAGGLVDFFVAGPKEPPSPAELMQRAEAAEAAAQRIQAAADEITEQKRQDINAAQTPSSDQTRREREERARQLAEEAKRQLAQQLELRRGRTR